MIRIFLVGFVWLKHQFSVSWQVDFQWGSCGSIFNFLRHGSHTFNGVRVFQSLVFCVMVGRLLVGFVWLKLQFSLSWQVDFQWGSCGWFFSFLCHGWQTFSGLRVSQSLDFCVMVGDFQWGSCGSIFSFLCHGRQTFSGVRVAQSLFFCVMVGRLLVGFERLNLQFSGSRQATFNGVRVAQSLVFCVMVGRRLVGFERLNLQFSGSRQSTFNGVRVAQSLVFCVMVGRLLVGFVWLNLQFSVSWQVDFQWGSCGLIFSFLWHGRQTFNGVRVSQSLVFCVMVGRLLVGFVWLCRLLMGFVCLNLVFCVMVGRLLVGFVWLYLQFSVLWQVDFQWGSCGSIFRFLCHVRQTFSGFRVSQSLVFCVMVGRLLGGSCGSIFSFLRHGSHIFSGVRVSQSLVFCVMVGRLLVGFVWLKHQFSVSWQVDFQWGSCG